MTFDEYWKDHEPFSSNPEEVARLAYNFAVETCAKIAESN